MLVIPIFFIFASSIGLQFYLFFIILSFSFNCFYFVFHFTNFYSNLRIFFLNHPFVKLYYPHIYSNPLLIFLHSTYYLIGILFIFIYYLHLPWFPHRKVNSMRAKFLSFSFIDTSQWLMPTGAQKIVVKWMKKVKTVKHKNSPITNI